MLKKLLDNRMCMVNDVVGMDGSGDFESDFSGGLPVSFTLTALPPNGGLTGFRADYVDVGSNPRPPFWLNPVYLFSRGSQPPALVPGSAPPLLPHWQPAPNGGVPPLRNQYLGSVLALSAFDDVHPSYQRLEGDVMIRGVAEAVTMYFFPAGIVNDSDFLLIELKGDKHQAQTRQSGIAHGNL